METIWMKDLSEFERRVWGRFFAFSWRRLVKVTKHRFGLTGWWLTSNQAEDALPFEVRAQAYPELLEDIQ